MYKNAETIVVIPSLEPDELLIKYVESLTSKYFNHVLVVDDGSSLNYQQIFSQLETINGVKVLHQEVNKGKGRALKTAYTYIKENYTDIKSIITADSDGQHLEEDCYKLAEMMKTGQRGLYLGTRDFSLDVVPFKSRNGNRITSIVFKLLYGRWLKDTQTGLRGFLFEDIDFMNQIEGERYEYEMQVLIDCVRKDIPFYTMDISTVYIDNNSASHFNAFKDSFKIYKIIFKNFFKFMSSSLICTLIDLLLFYFLSYLLLPTIGIVDIVTIDWISGLIARIISAIVNFLINRKYVFKSNKDNKQIIKYALLSICIICISNIAVSSLELLGGKRWLLKPLCDTVLYFVSYNIQNKWVFK